MLLPALLLLACEPADPSWNLLAPVAGTFPSAPAPGPQGPPVQEPEGAVPPAEELTPEEFGDPGFDNPFGPYADLGGEGEAAPALDDALEPPDVADPSYDVEPVVVADAPVAAAPAPVTTAAPEPAPVTGAPLRSPASQATWGLRLVATVPGAVPPRGVLGLPDGRELVVQAGSLLPEVGVVVLAVGNGTLDLVEVTPAGDHATVTPRTLTAQYRP